MRFVIIGLILSLFLSACNHSREQVDRQAVLNEMGQHEIKRVLPGEVVEAAYTQGDTIARMIQQHLLAQYHTSSSESGLSEFLQNKTRAYLDSLEKKYKANIHWISPGDTASNRLSSLERQILKAYLYNVERNLEINHNVQRIDDESYLYTKPIIFNDNHKKELAARQQPISDTVSSDTVSSDTARFLGMWSIKLSKKEIIQNM